MLGFHISQFPVKIAAFSFPGKKDIYSRTVIPYQKWQSL
jgi:hypothetical protein